MDISLTLFIQIIFFIISFYFLHKFVFLAALKIILEKKKKEDLLLHEIESLVNEEKALLTEKDALIQKEKKNLQELIPFVSKQKISLSSYDVVKDQDAIDKKDTKSTAKIMQLLYKKFILSKNKVK